MCAMTGLNIQFLTRDIASLAPFGEGVRRTGEGLVEKQEVRKPGGQANISNENLNTPTITNLNVINLFSCHLFLCSSGLYRTQTLPIRGMLIFHRPPLKWEED